MSRLCLEMYGHRTRAHLVHNLVNTRIRIVIEAEKTLTIAVEKKCLSRQGLVIDRTVTAAHPETHVETIDELI